MDLLFKILLIFHLGALVVGAATNVVMPVLMRNLSTGGDQRSLGGLAGQLRRNASVALGVLVVTGIAMLGVKYGSPTGLGPWFVAKMGLVLVVVVLSFGRNFLPITISPAYFGTITRLVLISIVVCSVMAFN